MQIHDVHMQANRYAAANMSVCSLAAPRVSAEHHVTVFPLDCWELCIPHCLLSWVTVQDLPTRSSLALCLQTSGNYVGICFPIRRMSNAMTFL